VATGRAVLSARDVPEAIGGRIEGPRADRVARSPRWRDGLFRNDPPIEEGPSGAVRDLLQRVASGLPERKPAGPVPLVTPFVDLGGVGRGGGGAVPTRGTGTDGVRVTWFGHASALAEVDGARVLFDPVWSERVSPSQELGPKRLHPAPVALDGLPPLDAVVVSHDHYDHLDMLTIREIAATRPETAFVVPLGVGAHLEHWGVPAGRIVELDWDDEHEIAAGVRLVAAAAQHFSGRGFGRDRTLWASWVVAGPRHRAYYTGDSGYFPGYAEIGADHGPFDVTLVQIGAYDRAWPGIHMTPEEGVAAHLDVQGGLLVPVHWGTFVLAMHPWAEPVDRLLSEASATGAVVAVPRPGELVDTVAPPEPDGWWARLPTARPPEHEGTPNGAIEG
jgi:L-ascorbate metabolism protein UlaG (beta-lactamase superfamily)